jgi:hypothetical protein
VIIFVKGGVSTHPCLLEPQVSTTTLPIKYLLEERDFLNLNSSNIVFQRTGREMGHGCLLRQIPIEVSQLQRMLLNSKL